jgi:hypothetical protein
MKKFKAIQKTCIFRDNQICTYWPKTTQCHFIACPLFSYKVPSQTKKGIQKRMTDSISFDINDFDITSTTTLDLIKEVRINELRYPKQGLKKIRESSIIKKSTQRMMCIVCGELITDDKFTAIRDPNGVIIYIHSKGKCQARQDQVLAVREKWLKTHTTDM